MTDTRYTNLLTNKRRVGCCKAAIQWNESDGRSFFSIASSLLHRTADARRGTGRFGLDDLPHLAMLAHRARRAGDGGPPIPVSNLPSPGSSPGPPSNANKSAPPSLRTSLRSVPSGPLARPVGVVAIRSDTPESRSPLPGGERGCERPPSDLPIYGTEIRANARTYFRGSGSLTPRASGASDPCGKAIPR